MRIRMLFAGCLIAAAATACSACSSPSSSRSDTSPAADSNSTSSSTSDNRRAAASDTKATGAELPIIITSSPVKYVLTGGKYVGTTNISVHYTGTAVLDQPRVTVVPPDLNDVIGVSNQNGLSDCEGGNTDNPQEGIAFGCSATLPAGGTVTGTFTLQARNGKPSSSRVAMVKVHWANSGGSDVVKDFPVG
jgi:hypothetical protein